MPAFDITFDLSDRFEKAVCGFCGSTPLVAISAITIGALSWSGPRQLIPLSLVTLLLLGGVRKRKHSLLLMVSYYAGATWQMLPGGAVFFGHHGNLLEIAVLWLAISLLLGAPWALLWSRRPKILFCTIPLTMVVLAIPPLGVIGCGSPLTAAGLLFPGLGWCGLAVTLLVCGLFASYPLSTIAATLVFAVPVNLIYKCPKPPTDWQGITTHFGGVGLETADPLREFAAAQFIQEAALASPARVMVFPETVVPDWNEATEAFWSRTFQALQDRDKTILFGASVANGNGGRFNTIIIRGAESQRFRQRIPVPIAMWKPYRDDGVPLDTNGPSIVKVAGRRITILICYEQLLIWPALTSFAHHPTIVVGVANDYWAGATTIPKIQHACLASWSRLFHVPLVWSQNT